MSDRVLIEYCQRLGILDGDTIEKCKENYRRIELKKCTMNETVKIVLSADFAAASCNSEFQTDSAIVLSGLRKKEYAKQRGLIEKLLDLGQTSTLDATSAKESGRTKNTKHNSENDSSRKDTKTGDDNVVQIEPEIQSYEEWRDNMIKKAQEQLKKIPA